MSVAAHVPGGRAAASIAAWIVQAGVLVLVRSPELHVNLATTAPGRGSALSPASEMAMAHAYSLGIAL